MARRTVITAATLSTVGLVAAIALTHTATAATTPAAAPPPAPAAEAPPAGISAEHFAALQRDLRLTPAQAKARLATDRKAGDVQALYQATRVKGYAGTFVESDGSLVVNVTSAAAGASARAQGARVRVVKRSEADLNALVKRLDGARRPAGVVAWNTDVAGNGIVVQATTGSADAVRAWLKAKKYDTTAVRVETTAEAPRPLIDVVGGAPYRIGGSRCSVGFSVGGGFVTAGHCGAQGARTTGPSGVFAGSSFPGNDYAFVRVDAGNRLLPQVIGQNNSRVTVTGSTQAAVGTTVCRSGSTTGWHCGVIQAFNASVRYPQGTVSGLIRTTVCAEPGDSGGSLLAGTQAQGLTSGGSGNCRTGGTTFFQPVNEPLQVFGLSLATAGATPPVNPPPTTRPPAQPTQPPAAGTAWAPGRIFLAGSTATFGGATFRCRQSHRAQIGWEPPNVPALWTRV
ncbi:trypsin-like serine protease [Spirilliplanes yamanashiensis]|uniref:Serine protease n=1 Tax=Spirilliplanes yamanashiensis TaxID=42233 RepID=A0A8J4DKG5_9ACTN|nr:carbohydrate-binding protein [Spirilliplanes yamanashiensis]MDP9815781.1 streptogrisin C [Spirilliplanes yamanashiensis]GIJ04035.1 serine protease [Spirilliplanes yamanashiensis]